MNSLGCLLVRVKIILYLIIHVQLIIMIRTYRPFRGMGTAFINDTVWGFTWGIMIAACSYCAVVSAATRLANAA